MYLLSWWRLLFYKVSFYALYLLAPNGSQGCLAVGWGWRGEVSVPRAVACCVSPALCCPASPPQFPEPVFAWQAESWAHSIYCFLICSGRIKIRKIRLRCSNKHQSRKMRFCIRTQLLLSIFPAPCCQRVLPTAGPFARSSAQSGRGRSEAQILQFPLCRAPVSAEHGTPFPGASLAASHHCTPCLCLVPGPREEENELEGVEGYGWWIDLPASCFNNPQYITVRANANLSAALLKQWPSWW